MEKILENVEGGFFRFRIASRDEISTLNAGYIITPDGDFIDVKDEEAHSAIFSDYLDQYLNREVHKYLDTLEAAKELVSLNHIVYLGLKTEDAKTMYTNKNLDVGSGYGVFILSDSFEDTITDEQKNSCLHLIKTNISIFGNYDKLELQFNKISSEKSISRDEFMLILESNNRKIK